MSMIAQRAQTRNVICVQVSIDRFDQFQVEFLHQMQITIDLLQHGIDDQRFPACPACEQIGIGAGRLIKELTEDHPGR